jgi:hypothetical protein
MFTRARKALVAGLLAFFGALVTAAQAGTVISDSGIVWSVVAVCAGAGVATAIATWATPNTPANPTPVGGGVYRGRLDPGM